MALPKTDDFTTDSPDKSLDVYDANWVILNGSFTVYYIDDDVSAGDSWSIAYWDGDVFNDDQYAEAVFTAENSQHAGVSVRNTTGGGNGHGYYFVGDETGSYFGTHDDAVWTDIGGDRGGFGNGTTIRLEFVGTGWTLKKNGGELASGTDATWSTGKAGLAANTTGLSPGMDDFEAGNMSVEWTAHEHKKLIFG